MAFGSTAAGQADVVFTATTGEARSGIEALRATFSKATGGMSDDALRLQAAQERLDNALVKSQGRVTQSTRSAELNLRKIVAANEEASGSADVASVAMRREGTEIERLGRGALVGSGLVRGLGRAAAFSSTAFLGGAGLVYAVKTFTKAAEDHQAVEAQLGAALKAQGINYDTYKSQIEATLAAQERLTGFSEEDTTQAFTKLARTTGDVTKGLHYTALAGNIARGANIDLASATNIVNKALVGSLVGLRRLGIEIPKGASGYQGLEIAQQKFAGSSKAFADTAAGAQARLTQAIHQTEIGIGTALIPTVQKLETHLTSWLGKQQNQERLQKDVNTAVHDGTKIIEGLAGGLHDVEAVLGPVVKGLGGLNTVAEEALVLGLAVKAKKAATALGLIKTASNRARDAIVADAAIEQKALEATGGIAAGVAVAEGAAFTGAGAAAGGGLLTGAGLGALLSKGGKIVKKGGELYLYYKGIQVLLDRTQTTDSGANRYAGSGGFSHLFSDIEGGHLGRIAKDLGEAMSNFFLGTHFKSGNVTATKSSGPATLTIASVAQAIAGGFLSPAGVRQLKDRFVNDQQYRAALALAIEDNPEVSGTDAAGRPPVGSSLVGTQFLSAMSKNSLALAAAGRTASTTDDLAALRQQRELLAKAITTETERLKNAPTKAAATKYAAALQSLEDADAAAQSQITSILQADASNAKSEHSKQEAAAAQRLRLELLKVGDVSGSYTPSDQVFRELHGPTKVPDTLGGTYKASLAVRQSLLRVPKKVSGSFEQAFTVPLALQVAEARAATTATTKDDVRVAKEIKKLAETIIVTQHLRGQALIDALNTITGANSTIGASATDVASASRANEAQFLSSFQDIVDKFSPNAFGKMNTHLYELVHESRRTNKHLATAAKAAKFPGTYGAKLAVEAAYG